MQIINWAIAFIIFMICFWFTRWLIFPNLEVGVYGLEPNKPFVAVWNAITSFMGQFMIIIVTVLVVLWGIYLFLKYVLFFPIGMIVLKIPPFPQLKQSGIFDLFSDLFNIITSSGSFAEFINGFFRAIGNFIVRNVDLLLSLLGLGDVVDKVELYAQTGSANPPKPPVRNPAPATAPATFDRSEDHLLDDIYQQCMEEQTLEIHGDMTDKEKRNAELQNMKTRTFCKAKLLRVNLERNF